ncbi:hypothetical protein CALCODRAFT_501172 [Calocera cornea HHB12733]|uniref:Uncharacterized protein n=1 Tax=Calocera cornea HHB12733 TaxID=1353952 RepID=A0A165DR56_9BASI|nr:hypothetical protein CALCODRAFT_501172 [Calocera cornea HHB12733]
MNLHSGLIILAGLLVASVMATPAPALLIESGTDTNCPAGYTCATCPGDECDS